MEKQQDEKCQATARPALLCTNVMNSFCYNHNFLIILPTDRQTNIGECITSLYGDNCRKFNGMQTTKATTVDVE